MKLLRIILLSLYCFLNAYAMKEAKIRSVVDIAGKYFLNQIDRAQEHSTLNDVFILDRGKVYKVLDSKPTSKSNVANKTLSNTKHQATTQNYLYISDGKLFFSNNKPFTPSKNTYRIQNGIVQDMQGNIITSVNQDKFSQPKQSLLTFNISITPAQNRQFGYVRIAKCSKQFGQKVAAIEHNMLAIITQDQQVGIVGRVNGLYAHLSDYSQLSLEEQYKYNVATKHINELSKLMYDQAGKFKGIDTFRAAEIHAQYLADMYGEKIARIKIELLANKDKIPEFQRIHERIDDVCHKSAGYIKQAGKSTWVSIKHLAKIKEKANLNTNLLKKIQQNRFNKDLAHVHNLNDQGYCLEALSIGEKTGIFKAYPKLKTDIQHKLDTALKSKSPIVQNIYKQLANQQNIEQLFDSLSQLSANHSSPVIRDAYKTFFNEQGICRFIKYKQRVLRGVQIPKRINSVQCTQYRMTFNKVLTLSSLPGADLQALNKTLKSLCTSMKNMKEGQAYLRLVDSAVESGYYPLLDNLDDLTIQYSNELQQGIQANVINTCTDIFETLNTQANTMSSEKHASLVQALVTCGEVNTLNAQGLHDQARNLFVSRVALPLCRTPKFAYLKNCIPKQSYEVILPQKIKQQIKQQVDKSINQEFVKMNNLLQTYSKDTVQPVVLDHEYNASIVKNRIKALQAIVNGKEKWTEKTHKLTIEARSLLAQNNIDPATFGYCYGNQVMQQFHNEYVDIINDIADLPYGMETSDVVKLAHTGREYAQAGSIELAKNIADTCHMLIDHAQAVEDGVLETELNLKDGIIQDIGLTEEFKEQLSKGLDQHQTFIQEIPNISPEIDKQVTYALNKLKTLKSDKASLTAHIKSVAQMLRGFEQAGKLTPSQHRNLMVYFLKQYFIKLHPVDQVKGLATALRDTTVLLCDVFLGDLYMTEAQQLEMLKNAMEFFEGLTQIPNLPPEAKADLLAQIAADTTFGYGLSKAFKCVKYLKDIEVVCRAQEKASNAAKHFARRSRALINRWKASFLTNELPVATTIEGIEIPLHGIETIGNTKEIGISKRVGKETSGFHSKMRGKQKSPSYKVEKAPTKSKTLKKAPLKEHQKLASIKVKGYGPCKGDLKMRYRHFLEAEVRPTRTGRPNASGWHHDPNSFFESKKIFNGHKIELLSKKTNSNGIYRIEWGFQGGTIKKSTFFPKHWSRDTVLKKVKEAFNYCKKHNIDAIFQKKTGNYIFRGYTKCKVEVRIVVNPKNSTIITAYPIMK